MWPFNKAQKDPRAKRMVFLIECLLNQNARDAGAAQSPAVTPGVIERLTQAQVGMAQIPCPEMNCLGFERRRAPGQSIRQALMNPAAGDCCRRLALTIADRIEDYQRQRYEVLAILGGNQQSPGCAVHVKTDDGALLSERSGIFMQALAAELARRGLKIPFRGMRDADPGLLVKDLAWLDDQLR